MVSNDDIKNLREKIAEIDVKLAYDFTERMKLVKEIGEIKKELSLPICDAEQEKRVIDRNVTFVDDELKTYYKNLTVKLIELSKQYQKNKEDIYKRNNVKIGYGILDDIWTVLNNNDNLKDISNRKICIFYDVNVPEKFVKKIITIFPNAYVKSMPQGELSKSILVYNDCIEYLVNKEFNRNDILISLGGGSIGDVVGFISSTYMRGMRYISIPTTLLSQVDASVGGKNAINISGIKNVIGTFNEPQQVVIDIELLQTLSIRQISNGIAESIKMGLTLDEELLNDIEELCIIKYENDRDANRLINENRALIEKIIKRSIELKLNIVENDFKEQELRRVLNFGHTVGHAIESYYNSDKYLHGECVGLGMLAMIDIGIKHKLIEILKLSGLPYEIKIDRDEMMKRIKHDKKSDGEGYHIIVCNKIGTYEQKYASIQEINDRLYIYE